MKLAPSLLFSSNAKPSHLKASSSQVEALDAVEDIMRPETQPAAVYHKV